MEQAKLGQVQIVILQRFKIQPSLRQRWLWLGFILLPLPQAVLVGGLQTVGAGLTTTLVVAVAVQVPLEVMVTV